MSDIEKDIYLIIGAESLIGSGLINYLTKNNSLCFGTSRRMASPYIYLDLSQKINKKFIPNLSFKAAIICAGITSVNFCEDEPNITSKTNVDGVLEVLEILAKKKIYTIFISSNLVFDGASKFISARAEMMPSSQYGQQKKIVENSLQKLEGNFGVLRLTKVVESMEPLVKNWYTELKMGRKIHPYLDTTISPCSLASVLSTLRVMALKQIEGVVQLSAADEISYPEIALHLAKKFSLNEKLIEPVYRNIENAKTPVRHASLDCTRLINEMKIPLIVSRETIEIFFEKIIQ